MTRAGWVLVGATGCGKSAVAQWLAEKWGRTEIWSADSMAVYRGMDVGTAKTPEGERAGVVYRGIDLADPDRAFSVADWLAALRDGAQSGAEALVVGGTGLYVRALTEGLDAGGGGDPEARAEAEALLAERGRGGLEAAVRQMNPAEFAKVRDPENPRRLVRAYELFKRGEPWPAATERPRPELVGLRREPEDLRARLARRVRRMFADGLVEEVRELRRHRPELSETARHAIGYEEAARVLDGTMGEEEAIAATTLRTRQYAKRQATWFRHQARVAWVDAGADEPLERVASRVERTLRSKGRAGFAGLL